MTSLILISAIALPTLLALGVLLAWRYVQRRDRRRSPLTIKVLNLPGEGLLRAIEKYDDGFHEKTSMVLLVGPIMLASWLLVRMDRVVDDWAAIRFGWGDAVFALVGIAMLA